MRYTLGIWTISAYLMGASVGFAQSPVSPADYTVTKSALAALPVGSKLTKSTAIDLPTGSEVVLVDANGGQKVCAGPYNGAVETCKGPAQCGIWEKMTGKCEPSTSAPGGTRGAPGGTRGMSQ